MKKHKEKILTVRINKNSIIVKNEDWDMYDRTYSKSSSFAQLIGKLGETGPVITNTSRHAQPSTGGTEGGGSGMEHGGWAHMAEPEARKS